MALPPSLRAALAVLLGLMVQVVLLYVGPDLHPYMSAGAGLAAAGLLVYGCTLIAERRRYTPWAGLAGLFSIIGVGLLLILPSPDAMPRPELPSRLRDALRKDKG